MVMIRYDIFWRFRSAVNYSTALTAREVDLPYFQFYTETTITIRIITQNI